MMASIGTTTPREPKEGSSMFASLRHADYLYLWMGNLFNTGGMWIQQVTLAWLVWELSRSASLVGIVSGLRYVPFILLGPLAGVAADRLDRRRLLMITQTAMAALAVLFAGVVAMGWVRVWHALLFSFVMGCGFTINMPVRQSLIANTVPLEDLGNAIALNAMATSGTRVIGPAIGGVLIVIFGAAGNFLLQAALFLCMVAVIFPMKVAYRDTASASQGSALGNLKEGIQYVWTNKTMLGLVTLSFIMSLFIMPVLQILPAFTEKILHGNADLFGYLMAAFGVGGFLGTLTIASFGSRIGRGLTSIVALSSAAIFFIILSRCNLPWIAFLVLVAAGFSQIFFNISNNTLVQTLAPDTLRGRVTSIYQLDHAIQPIAYFGLGVCVDIFSVPTSVAGSGIIALFLMAALIVGVKPIRDLRKL
jgi:MFS family permease